MGGRPLRRDGQLHTRVPYVLRLNRPRASREGDRWRHLRAVAEPAVLRVQRKRRVVE